MEWELFIGDTNVYQVERLFPQHYRQFVTIDQNRFDDWMIKFERIIAKDRLLKDRRDVLHYARLTYEQEFPRVWPDYYNDRMNVLKKFKVIFLSGIETISDGLS